MIEQFPRGKLSADDEGALNIRMGLKDNTFIIDFGKSVTWIGMSKEEAYQFARNIMRYACDQVIDIGEGSEGPG